jgi:hypothetical protein
MSTVWSGSLSQIALSAGMSWIRQLRITTWFVGGVTLARSIPGAPNAPPPVISKYSTVTSSSQMLMAAELLTPLFSTTPEPGVPFWRSAALVVSTMLCTGSVAEPLKVTGPKAPSL